MMEDVASQFRRCGYKYVKMDFMTHGRMEADHWYNKSINTGTEAYNYGMQLLDSVFHDMYLNLSISPISQLNMPNLVVLHVTHGTK